MSLDDIGNLHSVTLGQSFRRWISAVSKTKYTLFSHVHSISASMHIFHVIQHSNTIHIT